MKTNLNADCLLPERLLMSIMQLWLRRRKDRKNNCILIYQRNGQDWNYSLLLCPFSHRKTYDSKRFLPKNLLLYDIITAIRSLTQYARCKIKKLILQIVSIKGDSLQTQWGQVARAGISHASHRLPHFLPHYYQFLNHQLLQNRYQIPNYRRLISLK